MASTEKIAEYAAALSVLLQTMPLAQVRVKDICAQCGTDRQNFYYYFKDKYDLAAWIYKLDRTEALANYSNTYSTELLIDAIERMRSKQDIYINLLNDTSQNSLFSYMLAVEHETLLQLRADQNETAPMRDEELCAAAFDYAGIFQAVVAWVRGEYALSAPEFAENIFSMVSGYMKQYYGLIE